MENSPYFWTFNTVQKGFKSNIPTFIEVKLKYIQVGLYINLYIQYVEHINYAGVLLKKNRLPLPLQYLKRIPVLYIERNWSYFWIISNIIFSQSIPCQINFIIQIFLIFYQLVDGWSHTFLHFKVKTFKKVQINIQSVIKTKQKQFKKTNISKSYKTFL